MPQELEEEIPGIIVNIHRDWDALIDSIHHQPTFHVYEEHIDEVIDEALRVHYNPQALLAELSAIEEAVTAAPNRPSVAQNFYSFRQGILAFADFLHQQDNETFGRLREQFDSFWPYDEA
jgi:hypothetical protein